MTATIEKLHGPAARIEGYVDALDGTRLFGWAWDRLRPQERMQIEIVIGGATAISISADQPRPDLQANSIGDGQHAFEVELTDLLPEGAEAPNVAEFNVVAVSPSTGERLALKLRGPEEQGAEALTLLRQVASAIDMLGRGQRRLGAVLSERDKGALTGESEALPKALADIAAAQRDLQKQQDCFEVFLVRFDSMFRQMAERMDAPPGRSGGLINRLMGK